MVIISLIRIIQSFITGVINAIKAIYAIIKKLNCPVTKIYSKLAHQVQHREHPNKGIDQSVYLTPGYSLLHTHLFALSIAPDKSMQKTRIIAIKSMLNIISLLFV